jgi:hypothetical protein
MIAFVGAVRRVYGLRRTDDLHTMPASIDIRTGVERCHRQRRRSACNQPARVELLGGGLVTSIARLSDIWLLEGFALHVRPSSPVAALDARSAPSRPRRSAFDLQPRAAIFSHSLGAELLDRRRSDSDLPSFRPAKSTRPLVSRARDGPRAAAAS